jgi:3-oxoadipate enol-lactonase
VKREGVRPRSLARFDETFLPHYRADPARFAAFRGISLANDPVSYAATYRMLAGLDLTQDLPRIACPCLVLGGETDATRPRPLVEAVAAAIPGAIFAMVPSGHVMPMLTPELVARIIMDFPGTVSQFVGCNAP